MIIEHTSLAEGGSNRKFMDPCWVRTHPSCALPFLRNPRPLTLRTVPCAFDPYAELCASSVWPCKCTMDIGIEVPFHIPISGDFAATISVYTLGHNLHTYTQSSRLPLQLFPHQANPRRFHPLFVRCCFPNNCQTTHSDRLPWVRLYYQCYN